MSFQRAMYCNEGVLGNALREMGGRSASLAHHPNWMASLLGWQLSTLMSRS